MRGVVREGCGAARRGGTGVEYLVLRQHEEERPILAYLVLSQFTDRDTLPAGECGHVFMTTLAAPLRTRDALRALRSLGSL